MTCASTIADLRASLARYQSERARRAGWRRRFVPTGLTPLDEALPYGGLSSGAIAEIFSSAPGMGGMTLALRIARRVIALDHSRLLVLDTTGDFYPPAVTPFGLDPESLIVVRPTSRRDSFWAVDQSLRCQGVGAVLAFLPDLDERQSRRLQLAAESTGGIGLLLCGPHKKGRSFAAVRMLVEPTGDSTSSRAALHRVASSLRGFVARISLLSVREGMPSGPFFVDLYHAAGACDLHSVPCNRPASRIA